MSGEEAVVFVIFLTGSFLVIRPLAGALAKRIGGDVQKPRPPEVDEAVQAELHQLREDVDQLAERLDFAERMLARQRESPRIGQGGE